MSRNPVSRWQPNLSAGFLFRKPLSTDAAFTDNDRGKRMVFSRITANSDIQFCITTQNFELSVHMKCSESIHLEDINMLFVSQLIRCAQIVTEGCRLHNVEIYNFYSLLNIVG